MISPSDRALIDLQAEALFTHDALGRIVRVNEQDGDPAPRFFLGRSAQGNTWRIRHNVPPDVTRELEALAAGEPVSSDLESPPRNLDAMMAALARHQPASIDHTGPAYRFPDELPAPAQGVIRLTFANRGLLREMSDWASGIDSEDDFTAWGPGVVMVEDGIAVSICACSRLTDRVAEAGLETLERYRGRGHAVQVVAAWARAVRDTGRIPLYSTTWDNHASRSVARKLGLIAYGSNFSLL